jgi:heme/copper-type cytochrome/quinol oxidase subunit 2
VTIAILVVAVLVVAAAGLLPAVLFVRCRQVEAIRSQKLHDSYEQALTDMDAGRSWEWRFDANRNTATFNQMVWQVWRPVSSFYEEPQLR